MNVSPLHRVILTRVLRPLTAPASMLILSIFAVIVLFSLNACSNPSGSSATEDSGNKEASERRVPVPEFSLRSLSGGQKSDTDYRGKLILLNFWALWCAPCVAEMPALERLHTTLKEKGVEVVAISVDPPNSDEELKAFREKYGLSFDILLDPEISLPPQYGVTGFPETFFVGPDGMLKSFYDPNTKTRGLKVVSDRPWDSASYLEAVTALAEQVLSDTDPS